MAAFKRVTGSTWTKATNNAASPNAPPEVEQRRSGSARRWLGRAMGASTAAGRRGGNANRRLLFEPLEGRDLLATYYVSPTGSDASPGSLLLPFLTIQKGLDTAKLPGDIVEVREGVYRERIKFPASGSVAGGPITLRAYADEQPVIDVDGVEGQTENVVTIQNVSHVVFRGFEIINNTTVNSGAAIFVTGSGTNIQIRDNHLHDLTGTSSMGIAVYGTGKASLNRVTIDNNHIHDAEPAPSEALTLNGNVENFVVSNNLIHDINNIGIDLIGGEKDIHPTQFARNGVVRGNTVYNARSSYGDGYAAGIYVDGGQKIVIENNKSYQNDLGIEIGAENKGFNAIGITVRNNLIYNNDKAGLVIGGYAENVGRVTGSVFINNTVANNDTLNTGFGQLWVQYAIGITVVNNLFVAGANQALVSNEIRNPGNSLDFNMYWASGGSANTSFLWSNVRYASFREYLAKSQQDRSSFFADPVFVDAANGDFQLQGGSPAVDRGSNARGRFSVTDITGTARPVGGRPDMGAYEQPVITPSLERIVAPVGSDDLYHGVYPGGKSGAEDDITAADVTSYETAAGKATAWVSFAHNWFENRLFPAGTAEMIRDRGSVPYIRLMLRSSTEQNKAEPVFKLSSLLRGSFDNDLRAWGRAARNFATPLIVEFGPEMNASWFSWNGSYNGGGRTSGYGDPALADGPERFRDAYRRIITIMREAGATNITWVFHANAEDVPNTTWNRFENYYPGDTFIDWIGVSAFGAQTPQATTWPVFRDLMDTAYPRLAAMAADKPIIVSEFGVTSNSTLGSAATWATDAWTDLKAGRWPRIIGASWWNESWQNDTNPAHDTKMRLQDDTALRTAFATEVAASTVVGRPLTEDVVTTMQIRAAAGATGTTAAAGQSGTMLLNASPTLVATQGAVVGATTGSTSMASNTGATSVQPAVPAASPASPVSRPMVRSFAPRATNAAPTLAELARRAAGADDFFAQVGNGSSM